MDNLLVEFVGMVAGGCTTCAFLPQVIKVWKTRSCADISLLMYVVLVTGLAAWVVYGLFLGSPSIIIANIVTFVLAGAVLIMKLLWGNTKESA